MNEEVVRRIGEQRLGEWRVQEAALSTHAGNLFVALKDGNDFASSKQ